MVYYNAEYLQKPKDYGVDTKSHAQHEREIACGCGTAQNQTCDLKKQLLNFKLKIGEKKENKEFLGRAQL